MNIRLLMARSLLFISIGLMLILTGCATAPAARYHAHGYKPYSATGLASFYGHNDGFAGNRMANGEKFNPDNVHIAAHPYLPLGTKLKVTDLRSHKVLYVEVMDRMGHVRGRIIDLSYGASKYFGMGKSGLTKVHLQSVTDSEFRKRV